MAANKGSDEAAHTERLKERRESTTWPNERCNVDMAQHAITSDERLASALHGGQGSEPCVIYDISLWSGWPRPDTLRNLFALACGIEDREWLERVVRMHSPSVHAPAQELESVDLFDLVVRDVSRMIECYRPSLEAGNPATRMMRDMMRDLLRWCAHRPGGNVPGVGCFNITGTDHEDD